MITEKDRNLFFRKATHHPQVWVLVPDHINQSVFLKKNTGSANKQENNSDNGRQRRFAADGGMFDNFLQLKSGIMAQKTLQLVVYPSFDRLPSEKKAGRRDDDQDQRPHGKYHRERQRTIASALCRQENHYKQF